MTVKLGLTDLSNSQSQWLNANATFAQLNQLVQAGVVDKDLFTPPESPANEDLYIVATTSTPTGAWAGQGGKLAYWLSGSTNAWQFITPNEGFFVHVNDEDSYYKYTGSAWESFSGGSGMTNPMTTAADIIVGGASGAPARLGAGTNGFVLTMVAGAVAWAAASGGGGGGMTNPMTAEGDLIVGGSGGYPVSLEKGNDGQMLLMVGGVPAWSSAPQLAGYSETLDTMAALAIDVSTSNVKKKVMAANSTFTITGATTGRSHSFTLFIEGGATYLATWPASFKWINGAPTLTAKDVINGVSLDGGTQWIVWYGGSYV